MVDVYIYNDNLIEVTGLMNEESGEYINDADVSVKIVTLVGAEVGGETWPLVLSYVADSDGNYRATLSDSIAFTRNSAYVAQVTADGGPGLKAYWEIQVKAVTRSS